MSVLALGYLLKTSNISFYVPHIVQLPAGRCISASRSRQRPHQHDRGPRPRFGRSVTSVSFLEWDFQSGRRVNAVFEYEGAFWG